MSGYYVLFYVLVIYFTSFLPDVLVDESVNISDSRIVWTPSKMVVKFGDPISAQCTVYENCTVITFNLENSVGNKTQNGSSIIWTANATEWYLSPICFYKCNNSALVQKELEVIVYQEPQTVSISFTNHSGPMRNKDFYTLQCDVLNVAPVKNLRVTFYRGQEALNNLAFKHNDTTHAQTDVKFKHRVEIGKDANGAKFSCEAKLELGPAGPKNPVVVKSGNLITTVYYEPELEESSLERNIHIKKGEILHLNCSADGNPPPSYTWTLPFQNSLFNESVFTVPVDFQHAGQYTCNISNIMGHAVVKFNVTVALEDLIFIIPGLLVGLFLISCVALIVYKRYKNNRMGRYSLKDVFHFKNRQSNICK